MISEVTGDTVAGETSAEPTESVPALLARRAREQGDAVLIDEVLGGQITVAEFHARALTVANALRALGLGRGDYVATMLDASIDAHLCWIGTCWSGAIEVPVNPELKGDLLAYGIGDSRARVVITSARDLPKVRAVADRLPALEMILLVDGEEGDARSLWALAEAAPAHDHAVPAITDPYCVIYTSGTTGPSKGVVVPWGSIQFAATARLFAGDRFEDHADPAFYSPWPMFHSSGRTGLVFAATRRGRIAIRPRLSTSAFWDDIRRFQCSHAHLLGLADYLLVQPERDYDADNPLKRILMNPVIKDYRRFEERFGVTVSTGWGSTEIGFPVAASDLPNAETCGRLSPFYEVRIVDEAEEDVADGIPGQLLIRPSRSWLMLTDYVGKPEALAKAWRGGWFHTGDLLRRDPDGFYYFIDRMADYIRVRGNNVSSLELEAIALKHPDVMEAAAVGLPASAASASGRAPRTEDEIKLVVRVADTSVATAAEICDYLAERVPGYMVPRFVELVKDYPRTATGKVRKAELRALTGGEWERPPATKAA